MGHLLRGLRCAYANAFATHDSQVKILIDVLSAHFANGFRLNSPIELMRFRLFFTEHTDEEILLSDEELKKSIAAACGTAFDGKIYVVSAQTRERIKVLAKEYFDTGAQIIFYSEFCAKNESWLFVASVISEDMLVEILSRLFPKILSCASSCTRTSTQGEARTPKLGKLSKKRKSKESKHHGRSQKMAVTKNVLSVIAALTSDYPNGFTFDATAVRLLSNKSGVEIGDDIKSALKRAMFRRGDDITFWSI